MMSIRPVSVSSKRIDLQKMLSLPKCDNAETLGREGILVRALLKRSKVSPDEMLLLFYSQAGLPSKIQFDIVDDISNGELEDTSFYDLVVRYQDAISAVQSSDNQGVDVYFARPPESSGPCNRCGREGHDRDTCFANRHNDGHKLDPNTKTANGKRLGQEHAKQLEESRPQNRDRGQSRNRNTSQNSSQNPARHANVTQEIQDISLEEKVNFMITEFLQDPNKGSNEYSKLLRILNIYKIYREYVINENSIKEPVLIRCILDSGAGIHLSKYAQHLDTRSQIMVAGFNGSTETTNGVGDLPCTFTDALTGSSFDFSFNGVHGHNGVKTLISLGILLQAGFALEARSAHDILLFTPARTHCIAVTLGSDNILYFTCTMAPNSTANLAQGRATHHRAERPYCPMGGACCVGTPESTSVSPRLARVGGGNCQHARKACLACCEW